GLQPAGHLETHVTDRAIVPPARLARALNLADIAFTLQSGRKAFKQRRALVVDDLRSAPAQLRDLKSGTQRPAFSTPPRVVFLFPGQGSQYLGMGRALYDAQAVFRDAMDACFSAVASVTPDLKAVMFGDTEEALKQTRYTQPALFTIEYSLARL